MRELFNTHLYLHWNFILFYFIFNFILFLNFTILYWRREEGSGWGTHVYLWQIRFDIWQNQYTGTLENAMLKFPWRRQWHPTPVLLPGKSHGRRSLVGCSPWGR